MKKFLANISLMKIVCLIVAVCLIVSFISWLPQLSMKASALPDVKSSELLETKGAIDNKGDEELVAENGGKQLYVNPKTMDIKVVDTATGTYWSSVSNTDESETTATGPIAITYIDGAGAEKTWSGYDFCIADEDEDGNKTGYTLERIENGFAAALHFKSEESTNLEEYMPKQVNKERYEEYFITKAEELLANGTIDQDTKDNYDKALSMIYALSDDGESYYNKYSGTPPVSATNILIDLSKKVGYNIDLIREDSNEFSFTFNITENPDFVIHAEFTLDNGDLVVNVPTGKVETNNEDYLLKSITLLPNFGMVKAEETDDGFVFVPDGSGALFEINSYDSGYTEYSRPVYNNTYYDKVYEQSEFRESITMPVFGMGSMADRKLVSEEPKAEAEEEASEEPAEEVEAEEPAEAAEVTEEADAEETEAVEEPVEKTASYNGFMGIIESGDTTATINVRLAADENSDADAPYNKVYPSFDVMQVSNVKVFGPYSDSDAKFTAKTDSYDFDCRVRYKLYVDNANYYTMSQSYRDYLIDSNNLKESFSEAPKMFIDVVSALKIKARILGVPYDKTVSMTNYKQLAEIYEDLKDVEKVVSYKGAFNGGIYNSINSSAKLTSKNGAKSDLEKLLNNNWDSLYLTVSPSEVYKETKSFKPKKHALITFNGSPIETYSYYIPTGEFNEKGAEGFYTVAPKYLTNIVEKFSDSAKGYKNLGIGDLGSLYYENLSRKDACNPYQGEAVIQNALETLGTDRNLILYNPSANRVKYAAVSADISRESSDYGLIKENVPFRQLVLNGLTDYTTLSVNTSSSNTAYFTLQAVELASFPKYTITSEKVDQLKEANYNELFATEYALFADDIKSQYAEVKDAFSKIGTTKIKSHCVIADKVYETTYDTGVKVITNYNTYEVNTEYGKIAAQKYLIVEGGDR